MTNLAQALNQHPRRRECLSEWVCLIGATVLLASLVSLVGIGMA